MDTIFYNGKIYTRDSKQHFCSALAVKDGIIAALGTDSEILALRQDYTKAIDLNGQLMLPGFNDTHMHLLYYAQLADMVDLSRSTSFEDVRSSCLKYMETATRGKWIQGMGFNQDYWDEKNLPTRRDLDSITAEVPLTIRRACYHITVCNTRAMELMGLMNEKEDSTSVNMGFYPDGSPNGIINEDSQDLITTSLPVPTVEEIQQMILRAGYDAAACGITEVHTDDFNVIPGDCGKTVMAAYKKLAEKDLLPVRIYQQCSLWDTKSLDNFISAGNCTGDDFGFYRIGPLKLIADGSLGAHTAWLRQPYVNEPSTCGAGNMTDDEIYSLMKTAHDHGMQIATHCIGDASLQQVLDTYKRIQDENPRHDCRHGVVHCQIMDERQQTRFAEQKVLAHVQPIFLRCDMNIVDDCVGPALAHQSYNWRRFIDLGVHMSGGSDCPVESFASIPNLAYAVTRTNPETGQSWYPENGMTVEEAVSMFTYEGAYTSFAENRRGSIGIGMDADLVVLDKNIFEIPQSDIHTAAAVLTMVGGKIVYEV